MTIRDYRIILLSSCIPIILLLQVGGVPPQISFLKCIEMNGFRVLAGIGTSEEVVQVIHVLTPSFRSQF